MSDHTEDLPMGLVVTDDGSILNWRGVNYIRQDASERYAKSDLANAREAGEVFRSRAREAEARVRELEERASDSHNRVRELETDVQSARAEVASLARWKEEAMPVMDGLQELGKALRIPLGQRITGPAALEAVQQLRDAAQAMVDDYESCSPDWWPESIESLREVLERG